MWNNGNHILFSYINQIVNDNIEQELKTNTKLDINHIELNSYSIMNVSLAVQALSSSTANHFKLYYPIIVEGTSDFCEKMDHFFDIMNVRSTGEAFSKRKPFLQDFRSPNDKQLKWFVDEFLPYFLKWKICISERNGPYSEHDRSRMFISYQTYEGLQITVYSCIETVKCLLRQGMEFVLTERFNQDVAEEYFGRQRQ